MNILHSIDCWFHRPNTVEFYTLFVELGAYLRGNIPIHTAVSEIAAHQKNRLLKAALLAIEQDLGRGMDVSAAFAKQKIFANFIAPSIAAGEMSGQMTTIFAKIAEVYWQQSEIRSRISKALLTPKIGFALMVIGCIAFSKILIPQYITLFEQNGIEMPAVIVWFDIVMNGLIDHFVFVLLGLYGLYRLYKKYEQKNPYFFDSILLKTPIYKKLYYTSIQQSFADNLSVLIGAGMNTGQAAKQTAKIIESPIMRRDTNEASRRMTTGMNITQSFVSCNQAKIFDPVTLSLMSAGESTGNIANLLQNAAKVHEASIRSMLDKIEMQLTIVSLTPLALLMVLFYWMSLLPATSYMRQLSAGG